MGDSGIWVPPGGSADRPPDEPSPEPAPAQQITPEELVEQLRRLRISDLLLSSMSTVAQLAYAKLDEQTRDLGDARLAIDSLRALLPVLEGAAPPELVRDLGQVVTSLQLAYASAVAAPAQADPQVEG